MGVLLGGECSRWFEMKAGLRGLSLVLYNVYVMEMLKGLEEKRLGIEVEGIWCDGLQCVVDIVRLAGDQVELQVGKYAMKWRFSFNSKKSTTMMVGGKGNGGECKIRREWRMRKCSSILECDLIWMSGNVHLKKMREKAEKWGQELPESRVKGEMEVDRGRLIWESLARPCLEHAVWWTGGKAACKNLEKIH